MSASTTPALPPPGSPPSQHTSRLRDDERTTRKPLAMWDRMKLLVLMAVLWGLLLWNTLVSNPIIPFNDAVNETLRTKWWLLALICIELVRQIHYALSERLAAYHQLWTKQVFGGVERRTGRVNDWNRFRIGRALRFLTVIGLFALVAGSIKGTSPVVALFELPRDVWAALPFILQMVFFMLIVVMQFVAIFWFLSKGGLEVYFPDDIKTRFSDVWGQDGVLERVKENILFLENPESIESKGGYVPGGILLWGPPGTGKTLMAEAVAGETGRPYVFVDPGAFQNMFMGVGILKVKSLFRKLRKLAVRYGGVIVFFDEADALGNRGQLSDNGPLGGRSFGAASPFSGCNGINYLSSDTAEMLFRRSMATSPDPEGRPGRIFRVMMGMGMGGGGMGTLQALLAELSGLKKPRGFMNRVVRRVLGMRPKAPPRYRILVMMATNLPQALDEALLRPGRIDRIYKVGYPSKAGRVRTYEGYFAKVRHTLTPAEIDKLATITPYATGATIKDLVNEALIIAIRAGREAIAWQDVIRAKHLKAIGPPEDSEYIERERHAVAIHEACHAVAAYRVRRHLLIDIATIERRGAVGGFVSGIPPEDRFVHWRSEYESDLMVALASLAGERLFFGGDNSAGVSGDLTAATELATLMEGYLGMGSTVSVHGVMHQVGLGVGGRNADKKLAEEVPSGPRGLGDRIESNLAEILKRTEQLLGDNRVHVLAVAHALETHKTLSGDDVAAIIEGRRGPLVDGGLYSDPRFSDLAEAYHDRAVAAHREHGTLDVPLPSLNGHSGYPSREPVRVPAAPPHVIEAVGEETATEPDPAPGRPADDRGDSRPANGSHGSHGSHDSNGRNDPPASPWSRPANGDQP